MHLSFLPGGLILVKFENDYVITIEGEEVYRAVDEKRALKAFDKIRRDMELRYPARELTQEQKQDALKRLIGDRVLREVRNSTRKSKFDNPIRSGRFENR